MNNATIIGAWLHVRGSWEPKRHPRNMEVESWNLGKATSVLFAVKEGPSTKKVYMSVDRARRLFERQTSGPFHNRQFIEWIQDLVRDHRNVLVGHDFIHRLPPKDLVPAAPVA